MMDNIATNSANAGIYASIGDLIRLRPDKKITGFAPAGKVNCQRFGLNHSVFRGRGMEFAESRIYQPGDDVKAIDWRLTARTGKVHSKLYQEERERPVYIVMDCRSMMHFGSRVCFKSVMAAQITAILSWVAIDGGDSIGGCILHQQATTNYPVTRNHSSMLQYLKSISDATKSTEHKIITQNSLAQAVRRLRHKCQTGALVFIVSDFHDLCDELEHEIKMLSQISSVTNILVFDQLDEFLPEGDNFRISDRRSVLALKNLGKKQKDNYQSGFIKRKQILKDLSRRRRIGFLSFSTSCEPQSVISTNQKSDTLNRRLKKTA